MCRIEPGATGVRCGVDPGCTCALDGFTSIVDLTLGPDGRQYVSELDERSWAAVEFSGLVTGGTLNACDLATATCEEVATGIPVHTSVTFERTMPSGWAGDRAGPDPPGGVATPMTRLVERSMT